MMPTVEMRTDRRAAQPDTAIAARHARAAGFGAIASSLAATALLAAEGATLSIVRCLGFAGLRGTLWRRRWRRRRRVVWRPVRRRSRHRREKEGEVKNERGGRRTEGESVVW